jgi:predicted component of type VI protein secretion system
MALHDQFEEARKRSRRLQNSSPRAIRVCYDRKSRKLVIDLSSSLTLSFSPQDAQGLEHATPSQLEEIEISPSGFGIHFPRLDADLYLPDCSKASLGRRNGWRRG